MFSAGRVERVLFTGEMPNKEAFSEEGVTKLLHGLASASEQLLESMELVRIYWVKPAKA